ncbi:MAG: flagellar biosynthetic protein FliR [Betaproteobacteria bacterium]|nr:flagellar biosynthetic protein FliR [Betaproteobacteria bacterium]
MITVTSAQLDAWIMLIVWPLTRILALVASAPVLGNQQFPLTAKIGLAVLLTILVAPALPAVPTVSPGSAYGMLLLAREILIGIGMGLAMRVVFAAVNMAGDIIGLQMGLGFAQFYDPQSSAHVPVVGQFLGLLATLVFLSINGHLLLIATLVESFQNVPPEATLSLAAGSMALVQWGSMIIQAAVQLSLPLIAALLITNSALAVLTRASPQLNIFAIGFPITLGVGFIALLLVLPYMIPGFERLFEQGLQAMMKVASH